MAIATKQELSWQAEADTHIIAVTYTHCTLIIQYTLTELAVYMDSRSILRCHVLSIYIYNYQLLLRSSCFYCSPSPIQYSLQHIRLWDVGGQTEITLAILFLCSSLHRQTEETEENLVLEIFVQLIIQWVWLNCPLHRCVCYCECPVGDGLVSVIQNSGVSAIQNVLKWRNSQDFQVSTVEGCPLSRVPL